MFDIKNNNNSFSFPFNNRMEGIEIAESLLYKDGEKAQNYTKNIDRFCGGQSEINRLIIDDNLFKKNRKVLIKCDRNSKDIKSIENSSTYFRPISANMSEEFNDLTMNDVVDKTERRIFQIIKSNECHNKIHCECSSKSSCTSKNTYKLSDESENNLESNNSHNNVINQEARDDNILFYGNHTLVRNMDSNVAFSQSCSTSLYNTDMVKENSLSDSSFVNKSPHPSYFNNTTLSYKEANPIKNSSEKSPFNTNVTSIRLETFPSTIHPDSAPLSNLSQTSLGTTITIPQGSYIFIPLSVQNFPINEHQNNNVSIQNLHSAGDITTCNTKYLVGCYPLISHLQDIKVSTKQLPPIDLLTSNPSSILSDLEGQNRSISQIQSTHVPIIEQILTKSVKKKTESTEFNYYFNILCDSHKMLLKEKNKISQDRNVVKEEILKNVINYSARNNSNMNKLEKELNLLINSLFEINVLISKIEAMRGITFIEPFYSILQNAAELIQSLHSNDSFTVSSSRNKVPNKQNEKFVEIQIEKLKLLQNDIQKIRSFLWASHSNFTHDRDRLLSYSLEKLKSWCEMKKNIRQLTESHVKNQIPPCNTSNEEVLSSYQNVTQNSARQTMKFDRNLIAVQAQSFTIPVSQYHTIPSHMTTILQRFPNQMPPPNPSQYNYIQQTSLSNLTNPTLINHPKFSLGSNCHFSYGSQQQIYTTTPLSSSNTNIPPRNFLLAPSSLMTPIIYQTNSCPVINNGPVNFMFYKSNTQII